jgi:hypothetical protein
MDEIILSETQMRNDIYEKYDKYIEMFEKYEQKCLSIVKYLFFNFNNFDRNIVGRENDTSSFFKKNFDRILILNENSNITKYYEMKEKFSILDVGLEIYDLYDAESPENYLEYLENNKNLDLQKWCYLMTLKKILEESKQKNYKKICIIDNNAYPNTKIYYKLKFNKDFYKDWDILIFKDAKDTANIFELKSFCLKNTVFDYFLNKINDILISNNSDNSDLNNINVIYMNNIIKSNISKKEIDDYRKKEEIKYQCCMKIYRSNNDTTNADKLKSRRYANYYSYYSETEQEFYNLSVNYDDLLENNKKYYEYLENKKIALIGPSPSIRNNKNGDEIDTYDIVAKINNAIFYDSEPEYYGKRMDILYTLSIAQDLKQIDIPSHYDSFQEYFYDRIQKYGVKFIVYTMCLNIVTHGEWLSLQILRLSEPYNINKIPIIFMDQNLIMNFMSKSKKIPSAGYWTITNILQYNIQNLYLKGFTFFKDGHTSSYIGKAWHEKANKANQKTKQNMTDELKEKVMHSLVLQQFANVSPHNFDYEFLQIVKAARKDSRIIFDESIKNLYSK